MIKANNINYLRSFFTSRFYKGKVSDQEEFISENHLFKISGEGILCIIEVSEKILETFTPEGIISHFHKNHLFDGISKNPYSKIIVKSTGINVIPTNDKS